MRFSIPSISILILASATYAANHHKSLDEPFQSSVYRLQHSACVTLYHRNGRSGCGTVDRDAQTGPIFYYDGSRSPPQGRDFVAVIEEYDLSATTVSTLLNYNGEGNLKGILVLNSTYANVENQYSSPGPIYPLGYNTPSANIAYGNSQFPWNALGDGLNQYDLYGVPMAYVNNDETSGYIRESAQSNENRELDIFTSFNYYMGPDGINSAECLAWKDAHSGEWNPKCLPLGGTSVWAFAGSPSAYSSYNGNLGNNGERNLEEAGQGQNEQEAEQGDGEQANNAEAEGNNQNGNAQGGNYNQYYNAATGDGKPAIIIATSMDSTSMFHDLVPGANEGATNILTLLMAAYLLGSSVTDSTLDNLNKRIVFALFDGEAYGYLGSRRFLDDVMGFTCNQQYQARSVTNDDKSDMACLNPMRPTMRFKDIGQIAGLLSVDQVGLPASNGNLYVHNDGQGGIGTFMANVLKYSGTGTQYFTAVDSAAGNQGNGGDYPYPPTALTALQSLTNGAVGGAVLTGYDYTFNKRPPYQSHLSGFNNMELNYKAIASAATMLARTALAAAYDDGSNDYATAAKYAYNTIGSLDYQDEILLELDNCFHVNGNCQLLNKYASMEAKNERLRTGFQGVSTGKALGFPPNYYVGVYSAEYGQPFVMVGKNIYGAYDGEDYGKSSKDAVSMQPKLLAQSIRGLMNDFLGRGSASKKSGSNDHSLRTCQKESDCDGLDYCGANGDSATCAGSKLCVCKRSFYHVALDGAIEAASSKAPGFFEGYGDEGVTPLWTEPYWSNEVGIRLYRVSESKQGYISLAAGVVCLGLCFVLAVIVKVGMKKEKVY